MTFLKQFLKAPRQVGAVSPSSSALAEMVTEAAQVADASVVVEFGPGTGVITQKIMERLPADATFFAIEINPEFVEVVREKCPGVTVFSDSAVETRKYLEQMGVEACDTVVSGLPWLAFDEALQDSLLDTILDVLRPGGRFVTYAYFISSLIPGGVRFQKKLHARFHNIGTTSIVWRNFPPAFVYRAEKPS